MLRRKFLNKLQWTGGLLVFLATGAIPRFALAGIKTGGSHVTSEGRIATFYGTKPGSINYENSIQGPDLVIRWEESSRMWIGKTTIKGVDYACECKGSRKFASDLLTTAWKYLMQSKGL